MTVQGNGQPKVYRVSQLGPAKQALKWNYEQAKVRGEGSAFLTALRHIYQRLRNDPHGFGEPMYRLPAIKMLVCTRPTSGYFVGLAVYPRYVSTTE